MGDAEIVEHPSSAEEWARAEERKRETAKQELLERLRQEHGRICYVELPEYGVVAFRKPGRVEAAQFVNAISDDSKKKKSTEEATRQFAINCCVWPEPERRISIFDDYTLLATRMAPEIQALGGLGEDFEVKKG